MTHCCWLGILAHSDEKVQYRAGFKDTIVLDDVNNGIAEGE